MNPVTRQELVAQLQQTINVITNRTATHDELRNMMQNISQRFCSKQELQSCIDANRERVIERLIVPINEQQASLRQMISLFEVVTKSLSQLDTKIDTLQQSLKAISTQSHQHFEQPRSTSPRTVLGQLYA